MNLPKIASTIHTFTTVDGKKILFSQFTGGHEKMLLEAKESEDEGVIVATVLDVLKSIIRSGNIDKLPTFEIESLLLQSRIVSIGSEVEIVLKDPDTEEKIDVILDLSKAVLTKNSSENRIFLGKSEASDQDVYLNLKFPVFSDLVTYNSVSENAKIRLCLDSIQEGENYIDISESSDEELTEWMMTLEKSILKKISDFVKEIPRLELPIEYTLKDGTEKKIVLKDFKDFFM